MIEYKIEDTKFPDYKTATIFPREYIEELFISFDIHGVHTERVHSSVTIHVPYEFMKQIKEKTEIKIRDLVVEGYAPEFKEYHVLKLDENITLLHAIRKE